MNEPLSEFDAGSPGPSARRSPSPPAAQASVSWLQRTRAQLSLRLRVAVREPVPLTVLAVQRYLGNRAGYGYDVTLWDGAEQDTWLLSPELRHLVHGNRLQCGRSVTVRRCSYRYLEKKVARGLVCIEELEPGREEEAAPGGLELRAPDRPLCGERSHYLPLWNNEDPYGDVWGSRAAAPGGSVDETKVCSLQKLEMTGLSKITLPPLRVRVMHKSRLRYFGKPEQRTDYPYQAYFEVADHSGMMSLVLWNSLCPEWYNTLQVNNVVLLQQYAVKKSYLSRTLPTPGNLQVKRLPSLEISLNARDPPPKITIIPESEVKPEWNLPAVKYQFVTRSEFNSLPHNKGCDVIGLVTYVGRCERLRKKDEREDFWIYRWVHVIDGTSDQPFILEIFATSQPDIFENIRPMSYLVCTQMRVIQEHRGDLSYKGYLTTTNESQVFITGHHEGQPYVSDKKVRNFIKWMKTKNEEEFNKKTTIGGYHPYPPTPPTFAKFCNDRKKEILITIRELKAVVEQLHYREHKRVAVQGIIAACTFVNASESDMEKANTPVKRRKMTDTGVDHTVAGPENAPIPLHSDQDVVTRSPESPHFEVAGSHGADSETSETSCHTLSWENPLWSEVKHNVKEHLFYGNFFLESLTQIFDCKHMDILKPYNLHPAKVTDLSPWHRFSRASRPGHYQLTILGINQDIAIEVSLPMFENFRLFGINYLPNPLSAGASNDEIQERLWLSLQDELLEYARKRNRLHVICILDVCHLGESRVEVCLNRVYYPSIDSTD
ncbi:RPA-related protein RADX isoform X3 [Phyllobates terribilis]|uniref:RPA-related protein RADX isoform X3 n=1 Tax=Phyllobates terribilis TaxID=111132 RepID=UPI003CCA7313